MQYHLEETAEQHMWKIKSSKLQVVGLVAVCADDFLVAAEETQMEAVFSAIKAKCFAQIRKWWCKGRL